MHTVLVLENLKPFSIAHSFLLFMHNSISFILHFFGRNKHKNKLSEVLYGLLCEYTKCIASQNKENKNQQVVPYCIIGKLLD